jgi:L-threonylcarbamoyladenylate synthase
VAETIEAVNIGSKFVLDANTHERIRRVLERGGLVVHPTDTVYGLAADPFQEAAIERVYRVKERPRGEPLSMAVSDIDTLFRHGRRTPLAEAFCAKNLPGPYTVVLHATAAAPGTLVSTDRKIGLRIPAHPIPRLLAKTYGPITSTSANRHGHSSPTTCDEAKADLEDRVDLYIDGGPIPLGGESTIVDLSGSQAKILRQGVLFRSG